MAEQPLQRGSGELLDFAPAQAPQTGGPSRTPLFTSFDRHELNAILNLYGRKVADGEWRDYAIDHFKEKAVFSVFKRSGDLPLYQIEKNPKLAQKQGAFSIVNTQGRILKRGQDLAQVMKFFDKVQKLRD